MTTYRRPTDAEQALIADVSRMRDSLKSKGIEVAGVGMGPTALEDPISGRWQRMLGLPVVGLDGNVGPDIVVLLVRVAGTAFKADRS